MDLAWRGQAQVQNYFGNKLRTQITDILEQFIRNSWNLISQKVPGLALPVSIGKVWGFLNEKTLDDGY
jgi:hypothetical protein